MRQTIKFSIIEVIFHLAAWALIFLSPLLFVREMMNDGVEMEYLVIFFLPILVMVVFYSNYVLFVPRLLFKSRPWLFTLCNIALVASLSYANFYVHRSFAPPFKPKHEMVEERMPREDRRPPLPVDDRHPRKFDDGEHRPHHEHGLRRGGRHQKRKPYNHIRLFNDVLVLLFFILIAVLLRYTKRWFSSYSHMKELEKEKAEVELKNLKSQLNPHFLFNTLNNIYALIGIKQEKAQEAVLDLSRLLRYALYEGEQQYVTLSKEVDFVNNYIKLMKLRLANSVSVNAEFNVGTQGNLPIAQMLFITLVENAFKHGVSLSEPSFINMQLSVSDDKKVSFTIENSSFPKGKQDKSGSGIGIENLKRRLELLYPDNYTYNVSADNSVYRAELKINLNASL